MYNFDEPYLIAIPQFLDKSTNHEILHEDITQNHQLAVHDFFKQQVPPHLLTAKPDINSHTPEQNVINMQQTYKQKNVVTSMNNNKMPIVATNPSLATLATLPQPPKMPNGGFVPPLFPLYMVSERDEISPINCLERTYLLFIILDSRNYSADVHRKFSNAIRSLSLPTHRPYRYVEL